MYVPSLSRYPTWKLIPVPTRFEVLRRICATVHPPHAMLLVFARVPVSPVTGGPTSIRPRLLSFSIRVGSPRGRQRWEQKEGAPCLVHSSVIKGFPGLPRSESPRRNSARNVPHRMSLKPSLAPLLPVRPVLCGSYLFCDESRWLPCELDRLVPTQHRLITQYALHAMQPARSGDISASTGYCDITVANPPDLSATGRDWLMTVKVHQRFET